MIALLAIAAELVLLNGKVWTGAGPDVEAVAAWHGRIIAAGTSESVRGLVGPATRVIDLAGRRVLPGFHDSHVHLLDAGLSLSRVALKDAADEAEFGRRLREFDKKLPVGVWMIGGNWDHDRTFGGVLPTRQLLDKYVRERPVFLERYDGHMALANSKALALAGVTAATRDPAGGAVDRASATEPTGILRDNAMALVDKVVPEPSVPEIGEAVLAALAELRAQGVTAVEDMAGVPDLTRARLLARYQELAREGKMTVRVQLWWPLREWEAFARLGVQSGLGGEFVRFGGVKGFVDGSLGSSTAKMFEPYLNEPGSTGLFRTEPAQLRSLIRSADAAGLQVAVHAIGDRGNAEVLDAFAEAARANGPRDRRLRIEHAQHTRAADIARFASLGAVASMQPYHLADDGRWAETRVARSVLETSYAWRALLDAKAHLAFGTDWPIAPVSPLLGIDVAVHRRTLDGKHPDGWFPAQRISVGEAIAAYTSGAAYAARREAEEGTIETGKVADLIVLDRDIVADPEHIADAHVAVTVSAGRVVFER